MNILNIILLSIILILLILITVVIKYYNNQISKLSENLNNVLDDMIAEKPAEFIIDQETLNSKLHAKLKRLYEMLSSRTEQSQQDRQQMQSLISDISHQVKTPVANLKIYSKILAERELTEEERQEFLILLGSQVDKLDFLMQALVKTSRLEKGMILFQPEKMQVQQMIAECLAQVMPKAEAKNLDIKVDCPEEIYAVCDKKWTKEAVFNILDNAVKYTPENGSIAVTAEGREFYTVISIKDSGMGIPESEQALIFGRFYRSEQVKDTEGVGIGLFLARQIISEQEGFIFVKSEMGKGAEFLIYI